MPGTYSNIFTAGRLDPVLDFEDAITLPYNLAPLQTYTRGTVMALLTAAVNEVQSLAITATGGTYTLTWTDPITGATKTTGSLNYNDNAGTIQSALNAAGVLGTSGVGVSGSGPYVITFSGTSYAGKAQNLLTVNTGSLTGGSATVTRTTSGAAIGTAVPYSGTVLAPLAAPTVAGNGAGSAFGAGTYAVAVTQVTAYGESLPSPATNATVTAAQNLRVSAISSLNAAVTKVRYYVNGVLMAETTPSGGTAAQTDITGSALAVSGGIPTTNTAYTAPNGAGSQTPKGLLQYDCVTDALGNVTFGTQTTTQWGEVRKDAPLYVAGTFDTSKLTGLDSNVFSLAAGTFWRLLSGTVSSGIVRLG